MTQPQPQQYKVLTLEEIHKRRKFSNKMTCRVEEEFDAIEIDQLGVDYNDNDGFLHED